MKTEQQEAPPEVAQTKDWRKRLDDVLQSVKHGSDTNRERASSDDTVRGSRERSLAVTKIQEAIMWLGMDLKAMREEGVPGCETPYPTSYDSSSPVIEPVADGMKM